MKILIVGGGGREHALAWAAARSPRVDSVLVAPGNAGTAREPKVSNIAVGAEDIDGLVAAAAEHAVDLTIVGPEAPLVAGIVDRFDAAGLRVFGPNAAAARLEGSKAHTKRFLERHRIPTAAYAEFTDLDAALAHVESRPAPMVIKADGLAAGKGVIIAGSVEEARGAVKDMLDGGMFGDAGARVVVEDCLVGEEASFIAVVGGGRMVPLASSQDHKAAHDGDRGPNTGGMGAYSPAPVVDAAMYRRVMEEVMEPTVRGLEADGVDFTGFLYAGLMIGEDGVPRVLEFNCRLGDPETQPILMRLESDLVELCEAAIDGRLDGVTLRWSDQVALGVVMAAGGYPGSYGKGETISGLAAEQALTKVFHAGTAEGPVEGDVVTAGGRVLCVCALGDDVRSAQALAYERVGEIGWRDAQFRSDIGYRAIAREDRPGDT